MMDALIETVGKYALATGRAPKDYRKEFSSVKEARKLIYSTLNYFPIEYEKRQEILETPSLEEAYERTISLFLNEIEVATIKQDFEAKVHEKVDKNQKDYILREQMRVIREELGDE
ncbi:MAG: endopeptidase La, partial [Lachnospiraceae bacterium]|nr:endopeptidase La [Lachnospiraceae bacterium]